MSTKKMFVVESPNKIQTLKKILGPDYIIVASVGHIRNIPAKGMNIDIANGFVPTFEISKGRKDVVANLKKVASGVDEIILATDLDREGEAIAFHVFDILPKRDQKKCCRVTYDEITKDAILNALKEKRPIDQRIVDSQKARQVLDRLIGYTVSPLLWNNVQARTSAGRVQSIALKIVSDREKEITSFKPTDFWYVDADLKAKKGDFVARVVTKDRDNRYLDKKVVEDEYKELEKATFLINKVNRKEKSVKANHPFDTSSLQTTASTIFSWPVKRTSQAAQKLYEKGAITYIRTDSYKISKEAVKAVRDLITSNLGNSYLPAKPNMFKKAKGNNQEAHECIRPTKQDYTGSDLTGDEQKLYQLIRSRFIACQMSPMLVDTVNYDIKASSKHKLIAKGQSIKFDGWSKVYKHVSTKNKMLPAVSEGETLDLNKLSKVKGATKPPPRYNEGSLVKKMEEESVGRPSTYASIMENIQKREYVKKLDRKGVLGATDLGIKVSDYLGDHFNDFIMNIKYTAMLEEKLDIIESGEETYLKVVTEAYDLMMKMIIGAKGNTPQITGNAVCSVCKKGMVIERGGKWGTFYACDQYPTCKTTYTLSDDGKLSKKEAKSLDKSKPCPECKKVKRKGFLQKRKNNKQNSFFYGCNQYPKCKYTESDAMDGFNI